MKKKYVFITYGIINIGGGQMYLRNKFLYLKSKGFEIDIISIYKGKIILNELMPFKDCIIPELQLPIIYYNYLKRNKLVNLMLAIIGSKYDEIVIESNDVILATWGEYLAKKLKCKHILYVLSENSVISNGVFLDFLIYKLNRRELVGITDQTLRKLFGNFKEINSNEQHSLIAHCVNVVDDYDFELVKNIPKKDFTVGIISRLSKPYIIPTLKSFKEFVLEHRDKTFNLILIGGSYGEDGENDIQNMFVDIKNIDIIITGYLYPIPYSLLKSCDLFIGSSGSAFVSHERGFLTISIDGSDFKPIGILGHTTENLLYREQEPEYELEKMLTDILIKKKYKNNLKDYFNSIELDFDDHLKFLYNSNSVVDHFNILKSSMSFKENVIAYLRRFMGNSLFSKVYVMKSSLFNLYNK